MLVEETGACRLGAVFGVIPQSRTDAQMKTEILFNIINLLYKTPNNTLNWSWLVGKKRRSQQNQAADDVQDRTEQPCIQVQQEDQRQDGQHDFHSQ
jgi:hypothetical protein